MRRKSLLFVTYHNERFDDGLTYAVHLAKTLGKDLSVLLVHEKRGLAEKFSDMMVASAFAEAHEPDIAIEMMGGTKVGHAEVSERQTRIEKKCAMAGVDALVNTTDKELIPAVRESILSSDIEMVLLGPTVLVEDRVSAREINKLVKSATLPVVTITRQANAA
jgi:hypothetical protein